MNHVEIKKVMFYFQSGLAIYVIAFLEWLSLFIPAQILLGHIFFVLAKIRRNIFFY